VVPAISPTLVARMPYGLRVKVPSGEIGVVDRTLIHDLPPQSSEWPEVRSTIWVVCGGYTTGGQLRLSARESDLDIARNSSSDWLIDSLMESLPYAGEPGLG
jgi:hypothetical protein